MGAPSSGTLVAILPCNDLDASERFYNCLGFVRRVESGDPDYRILSNQLELVRSAASYVDRILRGTSPGDLPIQLPLRYELVINLKTAAALGLAVPNSLQLLADGVIE